MPLDLFEPRPPSQAEKIAEVRQWAAEVFRLPPGIAVLVLELRCTEPGCPPLETVIGLVNTPGAPRLYKLPRPLAEVTFADVLRLADEELRQLHPQENP